MLIGAPSWGAVAATLLTSSQDTTNGSSFSTASITPTANRLVLLCLRTRRSGAIPDPAITGNGLTWVAINRKDYNTVGTPVEHVFIYRALGASPSAGAVTIDTSAVGAQTSASWAITEFSGIDTSGTNGSGAIVQSATASGDASTGLTPTLSAFGNANNGAFMCTGVSDNTGVTPEGTWTELSDTGNNDGGGADTFGLQSQWIASNDTSPNATWTSMDAAAIAVEIKAAASAVVQQNLMLMGVGN